MTIGHARRGSATPAAVAFTDVVVGLEDRLVRLAVLLSGGAADAEDVVADAAARVWVKWQQGGVQALPAYLRAAVVNEVRRRGRRSLRERIAHSRGAGQEQLDPSMEEHVAIRATVIDALAVLGERQRTAIVLRYFEDLSVEETARLMGTSTGTVKSQVARGLRTLELHLSSPADRQDQPLPGGAG